MRHKSIFELLKIKALIAGLIILIIWLVVGVTNAWENKKLLDAQRVALERTKADLEARNEDIVIEIKDLQDPEFIEREARRKFNYQREGEQVVVFVPGATPSATLVVSTESENFFTKMGDWFKVIFTRD